MLDLSSFEIKKSDVVIVAVSGGPDSMALLNMLIESDYHPLICHINYHMRSTSNRDELIVRNYAENHNLKIEVLSAPNCFDGNFQNWARELRYNFFRRVYQDNNAVAIVVAHHLDDALETYLFKKMRHSVGDSLTIRPVEDIYQMRVVRPLLKYSKDQLRSYCSENKIEFGDDESNYSDHYTRNSIRLNIVGQLSVPEKQKLVEEMQINEQLWQAKRSHALGMIHNGIVKVDDFDLLESDEKRIVLFDIITKSCPDLSKKLFGSRLNEIIKSFASKKANIMINLDEEKMILKAYDTIQVVANNTEEYSYNINEIKETITDDFEIAFSGAKMEGICVNKEDLPLTIRTIKPNDSINLKDGHKMLNRLFIDKKVPLWQRKIWPIVVNSQGTIILVPRIYRLYERKSLQNNMYVLKYINTMEG